MEVLPPGLLLSGDWGLGTANGGRTSTPTETKTKRKTKRTTLTTAISTSK